MKKDVYLSPYRNYRTQYSNTNLEQKIQIVIEETDLLITLTNKIQKEDIIPFITNEVQSIRQILKFWINMYPEIQHSLDPIQTPINAPEIISIMCESAKFANVGPFASVAGTISQAIASKLHIYLKNHSFPSDVIVENGGDIFIISEKERVIGILANPKEECYIGIKLSPKQMPISICSSSAKIGHSLSFGNGDLAVILAKNASLADALATKYCNLLKSKQDIQSVIERAKQDSTIKIQDTIYLGTEVEKNGLEAVFLQVDENIGVWGDIELVAIEHK